MKKGLKLRDYKHVLLILYVPVYLISFFMIEKLVPETADYWVSYCFLDDLIPFHEFFIIPYYLWYPFLFAVGFWLMFKDVPVFKLYMYSIIIGFSASIVICLLFPNGQDLRPEVFPRDNLLTHMVKLIYAADTNTNVIPSVHAVGSILAAVGICRTKSVRKPVMKVLAASLAALISISTCFVKQHSILDVFAAMALCAVLYAVVYVWIGKRMQLPRAMEKQRKTQEEILPASSVQRAEPEDCAAEKE